ncbi:MAG: biotin--[acetyl-CoA-carboxylase] ligase [Anaerolineales bacterium]|nr:biotin--[acetyl-CoA-carboxylase] ligase [Anaerolineales bacterium]
MAEAMDEQLLQQALNGLPLGALRYYVQTGSTNVEAARWVDAGAPDLALVVADEQTAGRGRQGRSWYTPPGAALAFSLALRGDPRRILSLETPAFLARLTALGAVAVCQALSQLYDLQAQIKWPNDVLLQRRKVCGVLAEAYWQGEQLIAVILGIGINVSPASLPPDETLIYPATCVEAVLGKPASRLELLRSVIENLLRWRNRLSDPDFLTVWDALLAFKGEEVAVYIGTQMNDPPEEEGVLLGLDARGCLRLRLHSGEERALCSGELRLRPVVS